MSSNRFAFPFRRVVAVLPLVAAGLLTGALIATPALEQSARAQGGQPVEGPTAIPVGQTVPAGLEQSLQAGKTAPGTPVTAYTMQRLPISAERFVPAKAKLSGTVVGSTAASGSAPASIAVEFRSLEWKGSVVPIRVKALALASFTEVNDTYAPLNPAADRQTQGPANWTTRQVGGDVLMRSGWEGELNNTAMQRVGFADFHGVYADPPKDAPAPLPRSLGVFSAGARGAYGYPEATQVTSGDGRVTVTSPGKLQLRRGDELLLEFVAP